MALSLSRVGALLAVPCASTLGSDFSIQVDPRGGSEVLEAVVLLQTRAGMVKGKSSSADAGEAFLDGSFPSKSSALAATLIGPMPLPVAGANLARTDAGDNMTIFEMRAAGQLLHTGEKCYESCGQRAGGYCAWCGVGNACCHRGWETNSSAECQGAQFLTVDAHECVAPVNPTYVRDIGRKCGVCGDENDLRIGASSFHYDEAKPNTALEVCGPVCDKHDDCAGFNFVMELKRCYYRKDIACQGSPDTSHDCYTKVLTQLDSGVHTRDAMIADEEVQVSALQSELGEKSRALLRILTEVSEVQGVLTEKISDVNGKIAERDWQTAASAHLDHDGYAQVADLKSSRAMGLFVRRVVGSLGCGVKDEGGLDGFIPHYSGEIDTKTYAELKVELKAVCDLSDTWLLKLTDKHRGNAEAS